jgi:hypothetical protein
MDNWNFDWSQSMSDGLILVGGETVLIDYIDQNTHEALKAQGCQIAAMIIDVKHINQHV